MMRRRTLALAIACGSALGVVTQDAAAQGPTPTANATAEALFAEGRRLAGEQKYEAACPKFEGAQKVAPTPGTLLNLANCYEKVGRPASAWASFREAISLSRAAGRNDLAENAQKRANALEPRLPKLVVTVTATAPNVEVIRDGIALPQQAWGSALPVDPGEHVIEARAPGRKPFRVGVKAPSEGATDTVNVPELELDPSAPSTAAPAAPATPGAAVVVATAPESEDPTGSTQRTLAVGAGALGVIGVVVGSVFAARAGSKNSDSKAECRQEDPNRCTVAGNDLREEARSAGSVATLGIGFGAVMLGAGAVLFFTAPKSATAPAAAKVAVAPTLGGFVLKGTFR